MSRWNLKEHVEYVECLLTLQTFCVGNRYIKAVQNLGLLSFGLSPLFNMFYIQSRWNWRMGMQWGTWLVIKVKDRFTLGNKKFIQSLGMQEDRKWEYYSKMSDKGYRDAEKWIELNWFRIVFDS